MRLKPTLLVRRTGKNLSVAAREFRVLTYAYLEQLKIAGPVSDLDLV